MHRKLPPRGSKELETITTRYRNGEGRQVAKELGLVFGSLVSYMYREGVTIAVSPSNKPRYDSPPKLEGSWLILGEPHIPYHDAEFINNCFSIAQSWGIKNLCVPGDFEDLTAIGGFTTKPTETLDVEFRAMEDFFQTIDEVFDSIVLLAGNHLRRWLATLKEQVGFQRFIKMMDLGKAKLSDYDYCYIDNWLVTHPRNASVIAGRVPLFLSRKFGNYNIAGGHGHLGGLVYAEDGQRMCCDIGFSGDPLRFDWVGEHINTRPFMCKGSLILVKRNETTWPYWLHGQTDWEAMKRLYNKKTV